MVSNIAAMSMTTGAQAKEVNFQHSPMPSLVITETKSANTFVPQVVPQPVPVTQVVVVEHKVPELIVVQPKRMPFITTLGYQNNNVTHKDGLYAAVGTETQTQIPVRMQVQTLVNTKNDWKAESYGATVAVPFKVSNKFALVPQVAVDNYRHLEKDDKVLWSAGGSLEYKLDPTVTVAGTAMNTWDADESKGQDRDSYMFTVTKAW